MAESNGNGCGTKHFKLACWILGLVVSATLLITFTMTRGLEPRVRTLENGAATFVAKQDAMKEQLDRIEKKIDKQDK